METIIIFTAIVVAIGAVYFLTRKDNNKSPSKGGGSIQADETKYKKRDQL